MVRLLVELERPGRLMYDRVHILLRYNKRFGSNLHRIAFHRGRDEPNSFKRGIGNKKLLDYAKSLFSMHSSKTR
jgi:hypothetical protein